MFMTFRKSKSLGKDKKGVAINFLIDIAITMVAFMLIAGTVNRFMAKSNDKEAEVLCHDSIALRAKTQFNVEGKVVEGAIKTVPVMCKTIDKKITGTRDEIKEQIAQKMARCKWMFGEGRYQSILQGSKINLLPDLLGVGESRGKCFNCYTILIDQDEIEGGPITYNELIRYMYEKNHPDLAKVTFLDYMQSYGGPGMVGFLSSEIKPREAYGITMLPIYKPEGKTNWLAWIGGGATFGAAGGLVLCSAVTGGACALVAAVAIPVIKVAGMTTIGAILTGGHDESVATNRVELKDLFEIHELNSIYLSDLQTAQEFCISGDLAGE